MLTRLFTTASNCWTLEDVCRQHRQGQYVKSLSLFFKSTHVRWNHLQHRLHRIISPFSDPLYLQLGVQCLSSGGGRLTMSPVFLLMSVGVVCLFSIIALRCQLLYVVELVFLALFSTGPWNLCDLPNRSALLVNDNRRNLSKISVSGQNKNPHGKFNQSLSNSHIWITVPWSFVSIPSLHDPQNLYEMDRTLSRVKHCSSALIYVLCTDHLALHHFKSEICWFGIGSNSLLTTRCV